MKHTPAIYGAAPKLLGEFEFDTSEMMFWLYCPIKLPFGRRNLPDNLKKFDQFVQACAEDVLNEYGIDRWTRSYVYLSAKTMHVSKASPGNRPGWHSDGFLTDDVNYLWYNLNPTVIFEGPGLLALPEDHTSSLSVMDAMLEGARDYHVRYPVKNILRMDQTVLHKVDPNAQAGVRTFLKLSISDKPYALKGNSINHGLMHVLPSQERLTERNCPQGQY
jgi:hypothetical protein